MRAVHQLIDDEPKVLADPFAVDLIRAANERLCAPTRHA